MKRILASLVLLLALANPAHAGIAQISGSGTGGNIAVGSGSATTTQSATTTADVPPGNLITISASIRVTGGGQSVTSCSDSAGNTYSADATTILNGNAYNRVFHSITTIDLPLGGTISCLFSNTATRKYITALAFSGVAASPVDASSTSASNSSTTISAGPTGTLGCPGSGNCEVVISGVAQDAAPSRVTVESTGFTTADDGNDHHVAFKIVTVNTALTYAPTVTGTAFSWAVSLIGYQAALTGSVHSMTLLGVGK